MLSTDASTQKVNVCLGVRGGLEHGGKSLGPLGLFLTIDQDGRKDSKSEIDAWEQIRLLRWSAREMQKQKGGWGVFWVPKGGGRARERPSWDGRFSVMGHFLSSIKWGAWLMLLSGTGWGFDASTCT